MSEVPWHAAQGDDLKNLRPTIELNFRKISEKGEYAGLEMVTSWLRIYLVFATRQELINKGVRGLFSPEGELHLCNAYFEAVKCSPALWEWYFAHAVAQIKVGTHWVSLEFQPLVGQALADLEIRVALMEAEKTVRQAQAEARLRDMEGSNWEQP